MFEYEVDMQKPRAKAPDRAVPGDRSLESSLFRSFSV